MHAESRGGPRGGAVPRVGRARAGRDPVGRGQPEGSDRGAGARLHGRAPRRDAPLQLRRLGRSAEADRGGRPGRPVPVGGPAADGRAGEAEPDRAGEPAGLRPQRARRDQAGRLAGGHHEARRSARGARGTHRHRQPQDGAGGTVRRGEPAGARPLGSAAAEARLLRERAPGARLRGPRGGRRRLRLHHGCRGAHPGREGSVPPARRQLSPRDLSRRGRGGIQAGGPRPGIPRSAGQPDGRTVLGRFGFQPPPAGAR